MFQYLPSSALTTLLAVTLSIYAFPSWHIQFLGNFLYYFILFPKAAARPPNPDLLFASNTRTTRCSPFAYDVNGHKSNSTYFLDADISTTEHVARLVAPSFNAHRKAGRFVFPRLGSVGGAFFREIKLWQRYTISSRIVAWDEKWFYVVTKFESTTPDGSSTKVEKKAEKKLHAILLSKFIFKHGRATIEPEQVWRESGLIPYGEESSNGDVGGEHQGDDIKAVLQRVEVERRKGVALVGEMSAFEKLRDLETKSEMELKSLWW